MNQKSINNSGLFPTYLNTSSSDAKYKFSNTLSVELNMFSSMRNGYFIIPDNNNLQQKQQKGINDIQGGTGIPLIVDDFAT